MSDFDVVMFEHNSRDGITAHEVVILASTDDVIVVEASFKKPEPVSTVPLPVPSPQPPPEIEDPGPSEEQVDFKELGDLPLVEAFVGELVDA